MFEHNNVSNVPIGISITNPSAGGTTHLVIYNNVFDRGAAALAGSQPIATQTGFVELLSRNSFLNFLNPQAPAGTITSLLPTITWNAIPGATYYDVWLTDLTTGQSPVQRNADVTTNAWTITTGLLTGHNYCWWVEAFNATGLVSNWSGGQNFFVAPLGAPNLSSASGLVPVANSVSLTPTFTWTPVNGANSYDIWVNDLTTGQSQVVRSTTANVSLIAPVSLAAGHQYDWWVRALNNSGNSGPWSNGSVFTLTLGTPTSAGPIGTTVNASPTFSWSAVYGASFYDVWVNNTTTGQSQVLRSPLTGGTSWTAPSGLTPGNTYMWWVRALPANGAGGSWSNGVSFSVGFLAPPVLTSPITTIHWAGLTYTWNSVAGANYYDVWVNDATAGTSQVFRNSHDLFASSSSPNLIVGHTYIWWVRAFSNAGNYSDWSVAGVFIAV